MNDEYMTRPKMGRRPTHGMTHSKVFKVWTSMVNRCHNKSDNNKIPYEKYGARGIKVCKRWRKFENFLKDMGEPPEGMHLDRIDNDGNYEPKNCRWTTFTQNMRNKRNSIKIKFKGKLVHINDVADFYGINVNTFRGRLIERKLPLELAILDTSLIRTPKKSISGKTGIKQVNSGRFKAAICYKKKEYYLGTFDSIEEASTVYNLAKKARALGDTSFHFQLKQILKERI